MRVTKGSGSHRRTEHRGPTFSGPVLGTTQLDCKPDVLVSNIVFLPGSRTFWHVHERGQILQVTSGTGWVCVKGEKPVALSAGDVVWAEPGEQHWHGASDGEILCHTAISLGETRWLDEVTDPYPGSTSGNETAGPDATDEETRR